jgi:stage III sporulation protein AA
LLRSVTASLASGTDPLRVAVVDTRGELGFALESAELSADLLTGYPRDLGIEIATRTLSAQLIVCDEIGSPSDAEAILRAGHSGVRLLASAHGVSLSGILRREPMARLHKAHVFGTYVGIRRRAEGGEFDYTFTKWEEANGIL